MNDHQPPSPVERLQSLVDSLERQAAQVQREHREWEAERARQARAGDLGPDWRRLQSRIDAGETTLERAFGGQDDSPEARRLRQQSREALAEQAEAWRDDPELRRELDDLEATWQRLEDGPGR